MDFQLSSSTAAQEITVLMHDPGSRSAIPSGKKIHILVRPRLAAAAHARNVFVFVPATELSEVAEFVSLANRRHQLRALFVREDMDVHWLPRLFERAGLRTLRNTLVHSDLTLPGRVLRAWAHGAQDNLIADADVAADRLFVTSCSLQHYEVPIGKIPALRSVPERERKNFVIDEDGSYLHWPEADIHLDLDAIQVAIDPAARKRAFVAKAMREQRYGKAIARMRLGKGLKQSEISGLSDRQVRRIERGESLTSESLTRLAAAHGMKLEEYLNELAKTVATLPAAG